MSYYQLVFFNTTSIGSQGTGNVVLPRTKPYSTWLATGYVLSSKSGLSVAQPVRLPTNQGLVILANFPSQVQISEHVSPDLWYQQLLPVEGDEVYTTSNMCPLYGKPQTQRPASSWHYIVVNHTAPSISMKSLSITMISLSLPAFQLFSQLARNHQCHSNQNEIKE